LVGFSYPQTNCHRKIVDEIVKRPTSDRTWPDNVFISGGNPHLTSRFCGVVLDPTTISKMVSEPLQDPLGHLLSGSAIGPPTIYVHEQSPIVLVVRGCVKSPTSDRTWPDNVFISGGNPHLTSRFCGIVLGPTTISKRDIWRVSSRPTYNRQNILHKEQQRR